MKLALIVLPVLLLASPVAAQQSSETASGGGKLPSWVEPLPEHRQGTAMDLMRTQASDESPIPAKYRELIGLAVAAQIPCDYCVYAHTTKAEMAGATTEEINDALATAAYIRYFSTILNGQQADMEAFKKEFDAMVGTKTN